MCIRDRYQRRVHGIKRMIYYPVNTPFATPLWQKILQYVFILLSLISIGLLCVLIFKGILSQYGYAFKSFIPAIIVCMVALALSILCICQDPIPNWFIYFVVIVYLTSIVMAIVAYFELLKECRQYGCEEFISKVFPISGIVVAVMLMFVLSVYPFNPQPKYVYLWEANKHQSNQKT
eukprot:TRINITY_DN85_c0_g1_i1.p1 TRINITY_DN85_c0_g1~~TRINITY_DN85_c0_g1_i1.p1  ORF type:complete len:177 (+),score=21.53 TRINITY_DN85_c0_g1_i1:82-612(+)